MIESLAITQSGWDKLTDSQKKKFSKQHPTSKFSRAFNLILLKNKARKLRAKIKDLKIQSTKRISKAKKIVVLKSIKSNTTRFKNLKEEIKDLEALLRTKTVEVNKVEKPKIEKSNPSVIKPVKKVINYDDLPLPQPKNYKTKRWLEAEKFADKYRSLQLEDELLSGAQSNLDPNSSDWRLVKDRRNEIFDLLYDMNKQRKKYLKYLDYNNHISSESLVKTRRKEFYTYLDKVLDGSATGEDLNKTYRNVKEAIDRLGIDYWIALVNTNKDYPKYWEILEDKPELAPKIVPVLTLFDEEQIKVNTKFETKDEQNKFLDSVCSEYHLSNFSRKQELCQYLDDLSNRFIPFYIPKIETSKHYKKIYADIGANTLRLSALSKDYLAYDNSQREKDLNLIKEVEQDVQRELSEGNHTKANQYKRILKKLLEDVKYCCWTYGKDGESKFKYTMSHEFGHYLHSVARILDRNIQTRYINESYQRAIDTGDIYNIGQYASTNHLEFFAECFSRYANGGELPHYCRIMIEEALNTVKSKIQNKDQIKSLFGWN